MEKKKYLLIYHREDNDGVFSGAIMYNYLVHKLNVFESNITAMGADYNMLSTFIKENSPKALHKKYTDIIMTDVSFNDWKQMKALFNEFGSRFVWFDHHTPIIKASFEHKFDDIQGMRQTDRSAILCVWKFLYDPFDEHLHDGQIPEILRILSAYDSWTFEKYGYDKKYATVINKGVNDAFNLDFKKVCSYIYDLLNNPDDLSPSLSDFESNGSIISKYQKQTSDSIVDTCGDTSWMLDDGNRTACALFMQGPSNSGMFESLSGKVDNGIIFKRQPDTKWVISLYNVNDDDKFNCGSYMKDRYNGGGHVGAAGGTITEEQFIKILKSKTL